MTQLTPTQAAALASLLRRRVSTRDDIYADLYDGRPKPWPEPEIVKVLVCHLRRRLRPAGVSIGTVGKRGWRIVAGREQAVRLCSPATAPPTAGAPLGREASVKPEPTAAAGSTAPF